jgi:hypothetical protein
MDRDEDAVKSGKAGEKARAPAREARLAEALKANLQRRKAQQRARRAAAPPPPSQDEG